jgi:stearoyl-CoA desaturase (delta-9 desaturase)
MTEHSAPIDLVLVRPSLRDRILNLIVVVVPLVSLVLGIIFLWEYAVSWVYLGLLIGGYILTTLGITVGFHRLFTHKSFKANPAVTAVFGVLGSMAVQGPVLRWVATHRLHHQHSDDEHDPHSPHAHGEGLFQVLRGVYHAHIGWFFTPGPTRMDRYIPDLKADPVVRWVDRLFLLWVILGLVIPGAIALAITQSWTGALLGVVWGGLVRIFVVQHITWSVNSVCHLWGTRPFASNDLSRNNAIFGLLALGEGWHNGHHAFPASARHGLRWWELDVTYLLIRAMAMIGLVYDVRLPAPERVALKRTKARASRSG